MSKKKNQIKSDFVDLLLDEEIDNSPGQGVPEDSTYILVPEEKTSIRPMTAVKKPEVEEKPEVKVIAPEELKTTISKVKEKLADVTKKFSNAAQIVPETTQQLDTNPEIEKSKKSSLSRSGGFESKLENAQQVRIAQDRIHELEHENSSLAFENQELRAGGEILSQKNDQLKARIEKMEKKIQDMEEAHASVASSLEQKMIAKDRNLEKTKVQMESYELQLKVEFQKIKSRERELENRIALMKMENQAVVRSKDELILELKRNLDDISMEVDNYKEKGRDLAQQADKTKEKMRKSIQAIRLALSLLEGEEESAENDTEKKSA